MLEFVGRDAGRAGRVLDEFAERLAGDVDAGEQFEARLGPCRDAAAETEQIGVAETAQQFGPALDQPIGVVAQHDLRAPTRHQAGNQQFQAAQRHRARPQQMRSREDPLLAQVEDCQLLPVGEHRLEIARAHHLHHIIAGSGRSFRAHPHVACCAVICVAFPVARSNRRRGMRSRLVPVTRMKRALAG